MRHKDTGIWTSGNKKKLFCYRSKGKKVKKARDLRKNGWNTNSIWYILILSPGEIWFTMTSTPTLLLGVNKDVDLTMYGCVCVCMQQFQEKKSQAKRERKYVCVSVCASLPSWSSSSSSFRVVVDIVKWSSSIIFDLLEAGSKHPIREVQGVQRIEERASAWLHASTEHITIIIFGRPMWR